MHPPKNHQYCDGIRSSNPSGVAILLHVTQSIVVRLLDYVAFVLSFDDHLPHSGVGVLRSERSERLGLHEHVFVLNSILHSC